MTPGQADEYRAALALVAAAAEHDDQAVTAILGPGWQDDRSAAIAWHLARWLAWMLRRIGWDDPAWPAREAIITSIAREAEEPREPQEGPDHASST